MPYTWTCRSCGEQLYSAALRLTPEDCPRCGAPMPRDPDEPPPDEEAVVVDKRGPRHGPLARPRR